MDWVETTGKTVEEATKRALQHLGVGTGDAEVEVLAIHPDFCLVRSLMSFHVFEARIAAR